MAKEPDEVTTEELPSRQPVAPPTPSHPRFLFMLGEVRFEAVRILEVRTTGETLMLAQRRVPGGTLTGPCLIRRLASPTTHMERRRLVEEVELAFRLSHPAIAQVIHLEIEEEEDSPYVIMEYVAGSSLDTLVNATVIRGQPLSQPFGLYVGAELADALHYAHTLVGDDGKPLGIIHRDVSPRHVWVGEHGEVKLLDFGAAFSLVVGREESPESLLRGDVAYCSPEYLHRQALTPRSDIFSLGVLLVEVLTGRHLFDVRDYSPTWEKESRLRLEAPPTLPLKQMEALMAGFGPDFVEKAVAPLPEDIKAVLHTALRANPQERFATAADMRDALRGAARAQRMAPYGREEVSKEASRVRSEGSELRDVVEFGEAGIYPQGLEAHELAALKKKE
ncbi:serine/threonine protein kinase [Myxococcus sp. AM011]|uniref:serine/threonine-protein kinase n=1 Tax=Myxococcus sp. AM011 TaxID=2745200 RepID=UPI001595F263|nr:serine/threonine-protein kinase [Myxococcus sp. AM011]NVJ27612.1 serine/threonine protein kinase [Myxococcus sp. AM011]